MTDAEKQYIHPKRIFKSPAELANAFEEYKQHLEQESERKKWKSTYFVGREGKREYVNPKLPIILKGFYIYCKNRFGGHIHQYFDNKDNYYDDFVVTCRAIRDEIEVDHITGGLLNLYNPSITQRLHGLSENVNVSEFTRPILENGKELPEDD